MSTLERAVAIAAEAHAGVIDKAGAPYLLHPLRVMLSLADGADRIVAVLHDVVEDCRPQWTFERLAEEGFSEEVIAALKAVTKLPSEEDESGDARELKLARYMGFIDRVAGNPIGRRVKMADLADNMDLSRLGTPTEKDLLRVAKYRTALCRLQQP